MERKKQIKTWRKFQDNDCCLFSFNFTRDFHITQSRNMECMSFWIGKDTEVRVGT